MVIDAFLVYSFIKRLVSPFEKWKAYREGVIDKNGNIIVPPSERTQKQKESLSYYDTMLLNLKKTLGAIPGGSTRIATYAAALWLIREPKPLSEDVDMSSKINEFDFTKQEEFIRFVEEVTTSTAGIALPDVKMGPMNKRKIPA